jgi:phosphonoacetaldehyde hydrolase
MLRNIHKRSALLVVFDWAGTIVDHGCKAPVAAFQAAFQHFGLFPREDAIRKDMGVDKRTHIERILRSCDNQTTCVNVNEIYQVYKPLQMAEIAKRTRLLPGALDTYRWLVDRNAYIATTTGYDRDMLSLLVSEAQKQGWYSWRDSAPTKGQKRESGDLIRAMLRDLPVHTTVVKVGDTMADVQEGEAVGALNLVCTQTGNVQVQEQKKKEKEGRGVIYIDSVASVPQILSRFLFL